MVDLPLALNPVNQIIHGRLFSRCSRSFWVIFVECQAIFSVDIWILNKLMALSIKCRFLTGKLSRQYIISSISTLIEDAMGSIFWCKSSGAYNAV
jgi:hypothetical protein